MYFVQYRLLYMPSQYRAQVGERMAERASLVPWPRSGAAYRGFLAEPEVTAKGTIAIFHGNAGDAIGRSFLVPLFRPEGYRVVLLEYPGYGGREGRLGEASLVADGARSLEMLREEFDGPLIVMGESLGAGVAAAAVASTSAPVDAVALFTPWDTLPNLAAERFWFLPARWIVADRYDTISNLRSFTGPIAIVVAENDEIIPRRRSESLQRGLGNRAHWIVIPEEGHNTWPARFGRPEARELINTLLEK